MKSKHTSDSFLNQPSHSHRRTSSAQLLNSIVGPKTPVSSSFAPKSPQNSFLKPDYLPLLNKSPFQSSRGLTHRPEQLSTIGQIPLQSIKPYTPRQENFSILKKSLIMTPKASTHRPENSALFTKIPLSPSSDKNTNSPFKSFLDAPHAEAFQSHSISPTPSHRQVKFETQTQVVLSSQEKKEESEDRFKRIKKYIRQIEEIRQSDLQLTNKQMNESCDKILSLADDSFLVLNISTKEIRDAVGDSAVTFFAIEDNATLAKLYLTLIQEISEFPYSFIAKIKLLLLTVCEDISLTNPTYLKVLNQKKNNGLFILGELTSRELIREQLYRVIVYHFIKAEPSFYSKWKENFGALNHKKGDLSDIAHTFMYFLKPTKTLKLSLPLAEQKMRLLKEELSHFDPLFLDEDWWNLKRRESFY